MAFAAGEISYGEALTRISALRDAYRAKGYGAGHRVGILMENRPGFFLHWFALNALGVSLVPVNPDMRAAELEYLIGHSEIVAAVVIPSRQADVAAAAKAIGRDIPVVGPDDEPAAIKAAAPRQGKPDRDSECALLYTSGTTGRPKGCVLPNEYFLYAGHWYATIGGLIALNDGTERMLTPLPVFHMNAMAYSAMAMVTTGGCLIVLDRFHPRSWWTNVRESRATIVHYLGVMPPMLMGAPETADDRRHSVRFGFGAGVDKALHDRFEARFGFPLIEAWAMTETGAGAVVVASRSRATPARAASAASGRSLKPASFSMAALRPASMSPANCWFATPDLRHATVSSANISRTPKPPRKPGTAAGFIPATWCGAAPMARFISSTARRTSSAAPARISRRSRSRAC